MTKKVKITSLPVNHDNLIRVVQSRMAHRGRYIAMAEQFLQNQRDIVKSMYEASKAAIGTVSPEIKERAKQVLVPIKQDIAQLARDQKIDRVWLRSYYDMQGHIKYIQAIAESALL